MSRGETFAKAFVFMVAVGLLAGICLLYGKCVYDDPTCGFAHCVRVK